MGYPDFFFVDKAPDVRRGRGYHVFSNGRLGRISNAEGLQKGFDESLKQCNIATQYMGRGDRLGVAPLDALCKPGGSFV